jgi:glycosyltransferase involved in cell wall biosynthesis
MTAGGLRVGLLTHNEPTDPKSWSGTYFSAFSALSALVDEVVLLPWRPAQLPAFRRFPQRRGKRGHDWQTAGAHARAVSATLADTRPDVVFAMAAATQLARLRTDIPVVYSSDTTFRLNVENYPTFSGLDATARDMGDRIERAAISRAQRLIYPSDYAARSAVDDYGADPGRVSLVPYGANFAPAAPVAPRPSGDPIRVLFAGADWRRKGGDAAVGAVRALRARGPVVHFTVAGTAVPAEAAEDVDDAFVADRRDDAGRARLSAAFEQADVFLLPSRADCSPIVLCEAAAFALPVVASDVGGIPEIVLDGSTGRIVPAHAPADVWAQAVYDVAAQRTAMSAASLSRHLERLNWEAWARDVVAVLADAARR